MKKFWLNGSQRVARITSFFLRLLRKIIVSNTIFSVSSIIVSVFIKKEILNELNSTKVEMRICEY